jgi:hypothetical protein
MDKQEITRMTNIKLFEEMKVRSIWNEAEQKWYFSVSDVVSVLTESADAKAYWRQLKKREPELVTNCHGLKLRALDGKLTCYACGSSLRMNPILSCRGAKRRGHLSAQGQQIATTLSGSRNDNEVMALRSKRANLFTEQAS